MNILKALFCDLKSGEFSSSKTWFHIGCIAMTFVFVKQSIITPELLLSYGGIVAGNNVAIFWLKRRYDVGTIEKSPTILN